MAKSKKEISDRAELESRYYAEKLADFKTPYTSPGIIGDVNTGKFSENALNSSRRELNEKQLAYFHEFSRYNFRHGIEVRPDESGDEDPVIFGFDIIIHTQTSPLFSDSYETKISDFFAFGNSQQIKEIQTRETVYNDFINHFSKFFSRTDSSFRNIKSFYLKSIDGMGDLVNKATAIHSEKKQFVQYGKESENIKITMYEDNYLNTGYLAMLYNTLAYSKINGKQIIPENLLRFDMSIVVSEIRKFNKVLHAIEEGSDNIMNIVNDNISRYKYNLYDCQFNFEKMSHPDTLKNYETSVTDEYTFNIYYKFVTLEMEKFSLQIGREDTRNYLNNGNVDVKSKLNGDSSSAPGLTDIPYRMNNSEYIRLDNTGRVGNNVNTFFKPAVNETENPDGTPLEEQSEIDRLKEQEASKSSTIETETTQSGIQLPPLYKGAYISTYEEAYPSGYKIIADGSDTTPKSGIAAMLESNKESSLNKAKSLRNRLLNETLNKIRAATGVRGISSPTNVYNSAPILDEIKNFANTQLTNFIKKSN